MKSTSGSPPPRQRYEKPRLGRFSLKADEVLAKGCKAGASGTSVTIPGCHLAGCVQAGS